MLVHFLRHGTASHLLEDYKRKVTYDQFCQLLKDWMIVSLTDIGKEEICKKVDELKDTSYHLFYSPLKRTKQSAKLFSENPDILTTQEMPALSEIIILPPAFSRKAKVSIGTWINLCILKSFYTFAVVRYIREARAIMKKVALKENDVLIVSHQARIITLLIYCTLSPRWKIMKIDVKPAGLSVVRKISK